jgi:tol-pal system protein YbgF
VQIVLLAAVATGCATRASVRQIQADVGKVQGEVTEIRLAQDLVSAELARVLAEVQSLDARSAETQQTLGDTASEVMRLRTRLQATADDIRQSGAAQTPRAAIVVPPATADATPASVARPLVAAPPVTPASAPTPETRGDAREETPEQAFAAALKTFRAREHGQAVLEFMDFVAKYPKHGLLPRAQYWIGEAYYVQRDYPQALREFKRVLEMDPGALAASDAWLRIGMCHASLHQPAPATAAWQRVVREYPRSEAAGKARSFLRAAADVR